MSRLRAAAAALLALPLLGCGSGSDGGSASAACPAQLGVGYQVVTMASGRKAAVWYPTTAPEAAFTYAAGSVGSVARDAAPTTCARFPLVVFSHGLGGCGTQSLFFTETLARRGYVVAAPDHADALCSVDGTAPSGSPFTFPNFGDPASWSDTSYLDRKNDLEALLDTMLAGSAWTAQIDPARVGVAGHSLGGYTALGLAGAWPSWKDPRIKAAVLLSPYVAPFQTKSTLGGTSGVALMYQGADLDIFITPTIEGASGAYAAAPAPKYFAKLVLGTHFEWTNLVCLGATTIAGCLQSSSNAALIDSYAFAFLDLYLKGTTSSVLSSNGAGLSAYQAQPN